MALFVKKHFVQTLLKNQNFKSKNYKKALYETFMDMDKLI